MIRPPVNFDAEKFRAFYNLPLFDQGRTFWIDHDGFLQCPSLPDLTAEDLTSFVYDPPGPVIEDRLQAAETLINLILDEEGV